MSEYTCIHKLLKWQAPELWSHFATNQVVILKRQIITRNRQYIATACATKFHTFSEHCHVFENSHEMARLIALCTLHSQFFFLRAVSGKFNTGVVRCGGLASHPADIPSRLMLRRGQDSEVDPKQLGGG